MQCKHSTLLSKLVSYDLRLSLWQTKGPKKPQGQWETFALCAHLSQCTDACNIKPHLEAFSDWLVSISHDGTRWINVCKKRKRRERMKGWVKRRFKSGIWVGVQQCVKLPVNHLVLCESHLSFLPLPVTPKSLYSFFFLFCCFSLL